MHPAFTQISEDYVQDADATLIKLVHTQTGAQVLYYKNADKNKAFCIGFKTLVSDNTGVAHILEHSVLNGSQKYPVREPFTYLAKSSLQTYLNASTYPDKTIYPVSSINQKELLNMAGVYLDSVFFPNLSVNTFMQEGWRYDLSQSGEMVYSGVVFNEMKGHFANSDTFIASQVQRDLLVGTDYAYDAGGIPSSIPTLTYDQFLNFHKKYYHPSNSYAFIYGDVDSLLFLELLDSYFKQYEQCDASFEFKALPKLTAPKTVEHTYQSTGDTTHICVMSWAFPQVPAQDVFGLMVLHYLLITSDASPLKKYLLDKGLGTSLFMYGYESDAFLNFFTVGLKGIKSRTNVKKTEQAIRDFFSSLVHEIDKKLLLGAINRLEFMLRSDASSENSKGVEEYAFLLKFWLYGRDPLELLTYSPYFDFFKSDALKTGYFEELVRKYIVENTQCVTSKFSPDANLFNTDELHEKTKLTELKESFTQDEVTDIVRKNTELKMLQETPDLPEALDTLPMLSLVDVSQEVLPYPYAVENNGIIYTQIPDRKIVHLLLSFDISHVSVKDLPYVALFAKLFFKLGTSTKTDDQFTSELEEVTGALSARVLFTSNLITLDKQRKLVVKVSLLESNLARTLALLSDVLVNANFANVSKLKKLLDELKVNMENDLVESGHRFALRKALASVSLEHYLWDLTSGIAFYNFLKAISVSFDKPDLNLPAKASVIKTVINASALEISLSCSEWFKEQALVELTHFKASLPVHDKPQGLAIALPVPCKTFYTIPSKVNYVARSSRLDTSVNTFGGLNYLLRGILQYEYLWSEIRVKGGAYGGIAYCLEDGLMGLVSYRDPNISRTLQVYKQVGVFLKNFVASDKVLTGYKIGALSDLEPYIDTDSLGAENYLKYLTGLTPSVRQSMKDSLLDATQESIQVIGELMHDGFDSLGSSVVLGNSVSIQDKTYFDTIDLLF
ncbi:MAG: Protein HypA [Candidatus Parcubacteria bacterium]|jgi:Zn-dependent M16 (insulinase) family peptidase